MTWQDPGNPAPGGPGGPDDDATRADWDLAGLDALVGNGGGGAGANAGRHAAPGSGMPPPPIAGTPPVKPPAPPAGPPPAPAYPPAAGAGMAWAPPPTGQRIGMAYGGTFERLVAYWVDGLVTTLIGILLYVPLTLAGIGPFASFEQIVQQSYTAGYEGSGFDVYSVALDGRALAALIGVALVSAAISAAYFVFQWSGPRRATLGMRLLRLEIGNAADGRTVTRAQAFKRWLALGGWSGILSAIPVISGLVSLAMLVWQLALLITTASSPTKQGLHDRFAETAIVAPSGGSGNGVVIGCGLIIAAFALMFVAILVLMFAAMAALDVESSLILPAIAGAV
jgi:uncharacterized RDD family membrane protein YckC